MQAESESMIVARLQSIVEQHSDRPAIIEDGKTIFTYRQLWNAAGSIAVALHNQGCGPESIVAVAIPKSAMAIAAIVGVWRCGAAWTPLDIHLPAVVQAQLLEEARPVCVLRRSMDPPAFTGECVAMVVDNLPHQSAEELHLPLGHRDSLAYIIFTSGTSGQAKGVEVTHRGLVSLLDEQIAATRMHCHSRSLFLLSLAFDAAISDIGTALLAGAALVIETQFSQGSRLAVTPEQLLRTMEDRQITYVDIPPAMLSCLDANRCPKHLETLLIGGEICPSEVVRAWAERVRVVNVYGPTEATICSSLIVCDPRTWQRPLIGQPLQGVKYRIANDATEGELLIGGDCLARGYARNAELANVKFVTIDGQRYFRTGDLVRLEDDGEYLFLGRIDRQVKVRGHRIELEGIEAQLRSHPGVFRVGVIAGDTERKTKHETERSTQSSLVAFVTLDPNFDWQPSWDRTLRQYLLNRLPYWMVPQHFHQLPEMPLTTTGKIDYGALRSLSIANESDSLGRLDDTTLEETQQLLLKAFRQVMRNAQFDIDDDFLSCGGDSLRLMELVAICQTRGCRLSPQLVLQAGTVRRICWAISTGIGALDHALPIEKIKQDVADLLAASNHAQAVGEADGEVNRIMLTGATGFLGARVLERLLNQSTARVSCLLRGHSQAEVASRLRTTLERQKISLTQDQWDRVEFIVGDITRPKLGMDNEEYQLQARAIDLVIHCAADLSLAGDYASLWAANVLGTLEVVRFVQTSKLKRLCYASTLAVLVGTDIAPGNLQETEDLSAMQRVYGGYAQTKWAAEWLLHQGFPNTERLQVIRLGLLVADSRSDRVAESDLLTHTVRGLLQLGCVPHCDSTLRLDATPVDYAASVMTQVMLCKEWQHRIFHVAHPHGIFASHLFQTMVQLWPHLKQLAPDDFFRAVEESALARKSWDSTTALACLALSRRIMCSDRSMETHATDLFLATGFQFEMTNTIHALSDATIGPAMRPPAIDADFIRDMLQKISALEPLLEDNAVPKP